MEAIVTLLLIVGGVILLDSRGRIKRLEDRLMGLEQELQGRGAASSETVSSSRREPQEIAEERPAEPQLDLTKSAPVRGLDKEVGPVESPLTVTEPAASPAPAPALAAPRRSGLAINFEELFGRRLPIWAGGITLAIAGVLIVKYAIDIGLFGRIFTPGVQAICGLLFGFGLIGGAELAYRKRVAVDDPRVAQALAGAGISTHYASLLVAANAYQLISPLAAFIGLAVVTALALALSLRHGAPSALLGLAGGLAAPALTVGIIANVPMLAIYMAFTIAGIVGVARAQRWPWLALIALVGGAGWSLWLIIAGEALTVLGSLSIGMFVLLIAVAAPLFAFEGVRGVLLRSVAAVVGAAQLALLVAFGGFEPLGWGLFALIAAAGQWLAWRDEGLAIVPTIGAALSVLLLLIWPNPAADWLLTIGLMLAVIHAAPLLARLWRSPVRVRRAAELSVIAIAAPVITLRHYYGDDGLVALMSLLAALPLLATAAMGWKVAGRREDSRFAWLIASAAGLMIVAAWFAVLHWQVPLFVAVVAAVTLWLARPAGDQRIEWAAAVYALLAAILLPATVRQFAELEVLGRGAGVVDAYAALRWSGLAAMAGFFAWRAERHAVRDGSGFAAAGFAYGMAAQFLPASVLPLAAPIGLLGLAAGMRAVAWSRLRAPVLALSLLIGVWATLPMVYWLNGASLSLAGIPMALDASIFEAASVARRLFVPALLFGASLWLLREKLPRREALAGIAFTAILGIVAVHCFYRGAFTALFGADFIATGLAERIVWSGLILGAGVALWKRTGGLLASHVAPSLVALAALHVTWYSLLLHNPLWSDQAVGPIPVINLLLPLFAALPVCIWLIGRMVPAVASFADKALQPAIMIMVALFAWATLRQAFHSSLLAEPGVGATEDILRSILGIALAVGYLLWGIRSHRRDWRIASLLLMLAAAVKVFLFDASGLEGLLRIASFVALGFSLIGIGWLYSRQLRREVDQAN